MLELPDENGTRVKLDIYWPDEEQLARLRNCIETADTPYIEDTMLEETVYEVGADYMQGNISLEEAVSEIEKKLAIFMAE